MLGLRSSADRSATFEPKVVPKGALTPGLEGFNAEIVALYG